MESDDEGLPPLKYAMWKRYWGEPPYRDLKDYSPAEWDALPPETQWYHILGSGRLDLRRCHPDKCFESGMSILEHCVDAWEDFSYEIPSLPYNGHRQLHSQLRLLLACGARHRINDALGHAVWVSDEQAAQLLIAHGAVPAHLAYYNYVQKARRCAITLLGIKRFRNPALFHVDRFLIREIALAIWVARLKWTPS